MMKKIVFFIFSLVAIAYSNGYLPKILLGSPVHQKPAILKEFLLSLKELNHDTYIMDYIFIDDNDNAEAKELLKNFAGEIETKCEIIPSSPSLYYCDEKTHYWNDKLIWKVAAFKNKIIEYAKEKNYDFLFLIDSDILLHPSTINELVKTNKDIVSNIFWTSWQPNTIPLPQVWMSDEYTLYEKNPGEQLSQNEINKRTDTFLEMLKKPGTYRVGGLGACTLISKEALLKGVSFERITNLSYWGEDRHFCVRADALGIPLYVDTHFPAYHIYREQLLSGVEEYKKNNLMDKKSNIFYPKITLAMTITNEADHFLKAVLKDARNYISAAVIIDDASTDDSVKICEEELSGIPLTIIKNDESKFSNEVILRKEVWEETIKTNPEWILLLDADEIFEHKFSEQVNEMLLNANVDAYYFRLYDFWDANHYRDDNFWKAHHYYRPFLVRYKPGIDYKWKETPLHCGRLPLNIYDFSYQISNLRLKHYGWSTPEVRLSKYNRYIQLDPLGTYGSRAQYDSILDENPNLIEWVE
jgi:hypothetical protein